MASIATLTETVARGSGTFRLTWEVNHARDVHRMISHVRSMFVSHGVPNMLDVSRHETAVTFVAGFPTADVDKVARVGRMLAETFA